MYTETNGIKYKIEKDNRLWGNGKTYVVSKWDSTQGIYTKPDIYTAAELTKRKIIVLIRSKP